MTPTNEQSASTGDLFDVRTARLWVGYFVHSLRRHWFRAGVGFTAVLVATMFFVLSATKAYAADTLILTRSNLVAPSIVNPGRTVPTDSEDPTLNARELVLSDDNMLKIIDEAKLVELWNSNEPKLARVKRKFFEKVFGANPDPAVKRDQLLGLLRSSLKVETAAKESVTIGVSWNDPFQAKSIVEVAMKNFLAERQRVDIGQYQEALATAELASAAADANVEELRTRLNIAETSTELLPESSPMRLALTLQNNASQRLETARLEHTLAKKAFDYKYQVVNPPRLPEGPVSGPFKLLVAGLLASIMAAFFAAAVPDLLRGRVVEPWQISRRLNLPILAQLD